MKTVPLWAWIAGSGLVALAALGGGSRPVEARLFPVKGGRWPSRPLLRFGYVRSATHTHQGVDIGAREGTPVVAALSGTVDRVARALAPGFSGYGRVIVLRSDTRPQVWLMYAHLEGVRVRQGEKVRAGEVIGTVGATCFRRSDPTAQCGGPHLHFEVSPRPYPQNSEAWRYDPEQALARLHAGRSLASVRRTA